MTELDIVRPNLAQFAPTNWKELCLFADMMARSKSVPECYRGDPAAVIYAVQMGAELGLGPGQSIQSIANIEGNLRLWGDTPLAIVQASGKLEWISESNNFDPPPAPKEPEAVENWKLLLSTWKEPPEAEWFAVCIVQRKGEAEPKVQRYAYDDAVRAGLWARKSNSGKAMPWTTSPKRLMKYRARGFLLRDVFPDVLKGIAIREEFGDEYGERNVTPAAPSGTGNDALREKMAASMGAAAVATPATPPTSTVDPDVPDFDAMIVAQVAETLEQAAQARGIDAATYRQIVVDTVGKRLTKENAPEVWRAIGAWEKPAPAEGAAEGEPAQETLLPE